LYTNVNSSLVHIIHKRNNPNVHYLMNEQAKNDILIQCNIIW
jgi:hypothetical protein